MHKDGADIMKYKLLLPWIIFVLVSSAALAAPTTSGEGSSSTSSTSTTTTTTSTTTTTTPCDILTSEQRDFVLMSHGGQFYGCGLDVDQIACINHQAGDTLMDDMHNLGVCETPGVDSDFYCALGLERKFPSDSTEDNIHEDFLMFFEDGAIETPYRAQINPRSNSGILAIYINDPVTYDEAKYFRDWKIDELICDSTEEGCYWRRNNMWDGLETGGTGPDAENYKRYSNYSEDDGFMTHRNGAGDLVPADTPVTACCPEEWLWNGTVCTKAFDQSVPEVEPMDFIEYHFLNATNAWLPVIDGEELKWVLYYNKSMWRDGDQLGMGWLGEAGLCPYDDNCLFYTVSDDARCENNSFFKDGHVCGEYDTTEGTTSAWTSRSMATATILLKIAEAKTWTEYTLMCDEYVSMPLAYATKMNSTCVLRNGDFVVVGAHLREWQEYDAWGDDETPGDPHPEIQDRHNQILEQFFEGLVGSLGDLYDEIDFYVAGSENPNGFDPSILHYIDFFQQGTIDTNDHILKSGAWLNDSSIVLLSNKEAGTGADEVDYDVDVSDINNVNTFLTYFPHLRDYKKTAAGTMPANGYSAPTLDLDSLGSSYGYTKLEDMLADYDSNQYSIIFKHKSPTKNIEMVMEPQALYNPIGVKNHYLYAHFNGTDIVDMEATICDGLETNYTADYAPFPFGGSYALLKHCKEKVGAVAFFSIVDPGVQWRMHRDRNLVSFFDHLWEDVAAAERDFSKCVENKTWVNSEESYQYELSPLPVEYLNDVDIIKNQYIPFDNMKTHGCCLETDCWNGFSCTAENEVFEIDYAGVQKTYVCSDAGWSTGKNRTNWAATDSNWCSDGESCWLPQDMYVEECTQHCEGDCTTDCEAEFSDLQGTSLDGRDCTVAENFTFYRDHACFDEGNWTTRTGLIAAKFREYMDGLAIDYVLFCDNYTNALNFLAYTGEVPVLGTGTAVAAYISGKNLGDGIPREITKGNPTNNFCVLSYDNQVAFGTSLNKMIIIPYVLGSGWVEGVTTHPQVFMDTIFPLGSGISSNYNIPADKKNEFYNIDSQKVWLHDKLQLLIINPSGMALEPEPVTIWGYFIDPIQTVITWIQNIFEDPTIRGPERADIIYNAVSGYNTVDAFVDKREGSKSSALKYNNLITDMCDTLNRSIQSEDLECEGIAEQLITSTEFDDIYQQWIYMTSRLRVQYGTSTTTTTTTTTTTSLAS